jgi:pilus assembly protein Flp/PilA
MNNYSIRKIKGATMIEYVLVVGLIAIAAVVIMTTLGTSVSSVFTKVNTNLPK